MEASIKTLVVISLKFSATDLIKLLEFSICLVDMFFKTVSIPMGTNHSFSQLIVHQILNISNKTGATNEAGTSYPSS